MTHRLIFGLLLSAGVLLVLSFKSTTDNYKLAVGYDVESLIGDDDLDQDLNSCIQKASSKWGGNCLNYGFSESKYAVDLVNTCNEKLDLMSCVQRENGRWQCFYRMDMPQNDTLHAYACRGNGKYLKWVRKAGDINTKFPSLAQVNDEY